MVNTALVLPFWPEAPSVIIFSFDFCEDFLFPFFSLYFLKIHYLLGSFTFTEKLRERCRVLLYAFPSPTCTASPTNNSPAQREHLEQWKNLRWHIVTQSPQFTWGLRLGAGSMGLNKRVMTCIHHDSIVQSSCTEILKISVFHLIISPSSQHLGTTDIFTP